MATVAIEVLIKSSDRIDMFYPVMPFSTVAAINLYVSLTDVTGNYSKVMALISNEPTLEGGRNVNFRLNLADVQDLGGAFTNASFDSTPLFFRATTVSPAGSESAIGSALTKYVGVVGYTPTGEPDNPAQNKHMYAFSEASLNWNRVRETAAGALQVSTSAFYEDNLSIVRTLDGSNRILTEMIFQTSAPTGAKAKLVTYTYSGVLTTPLTITYSDATKP